MIKKIIIHIVCTIFITIIVTSCCMICTSIENNDGKCTDFYISNDTIQFQTGLGWFILGYHAFLEFDENFLYGFEFLIRDSSYYVTKENPDIIIYDLSFTSMKGDTLPYNLYYYNCNNISKRGGQCGVDIINQANNVFPLHVTRDMKESESIRHRYAIFALSRMSTNKLRKIYVNYDIAVYGKHYEGHVLYRRKTKLDCRPVFR